MNRSSALFTVLFSLFAFQAKAQWFPAQAQITVLPGQVTAAVYNPHFEPIICNGQVFGQTSAGPVLNAYFAEQLLPAGGYRYANVYANWVSPFVNGWVNIHCRFVRFW